MYYFCPASFTQHSAFAIQLCGFFSFLSYIQWCANKCLTTGSQKIPKTKQNKTLWIVGLANFPDVNTPKVENFQWLICCQSFWKIPENWTVTSHDQTRASSSTPLLISHCMNTSQSVLLLMWACEFFSTFAYYDLSSYKYSYTSLWLNIHFHYILVNTKE